MYAHIKINKYIIFKYSHLQIGTNYNLLVGT